MPNKHAAIKDLRKNKRRAARNIRVKQNVKALFKKCLALLAEGKGDEAKDMAKQFQQAIDKAAKLHVVHKNEASRKKSAMAKKFNASKK